LVDRVDNPKDARSYLYKTTLDLLSHLGIGKVTDLPEYEQVRKDIESFKLTNVATEGSAASEVSAATQNDATIDQ
jgi:hypothetical protein